ncbi:MAG: transcription elongation factor GreA [Spirochaetae bacterium HGW-Spirochaetae-2]|jgi:transcription elongation factor GreA|nr:MAG: transcription elongation factor GreA [Spirochaetae bacterium HGW-Spirochaetae-2]
MNEENIKTLLTEEKWTRATINNYTIPNFQELDVILNQIESPEELLEVKSICDEYLQKNKNSIIAMYLSGSIALRRRSLDYGNITNLIEMFNESKKYSIVEHLSLKVLERFEDKYVIRVLAACYEKLNREDDKFVLYERLVKVDYDETDLLQAIAERYISKNNKEKALFFYKKSLQRYLNAQNLPAVKDVWTILLRMIPDDFAYLLGLAQRVSTRFQGERTNQMLSQLYDVAVQKEDWDQGVNVLKTMLDTDPHSEWARERLVECYRQKYVGHSRLEACIEISNLTKAYRDVHSAIDDFEKNIAFDKGSFVFHKTWSIGRIRELSHENVVIDFSSKRNHSMSLGMAFSSLQVLPKHHIWVLKSVFPKEKLTEKFIGDVPWGLRTLISSHGNAATLKDMKAEIVPSILTVKEWTSWLSSAKKVLMSDPLIGFLPNDPDVFTVRETPISYEEKSLGIFRNEKRFYQKVRIVREFLVNGDPETEFFMEMVQYFVDQCTNYQMVNDQVISSYLFVDFLCDKYPFLERPNTVDFKHLYGLMDNIPKIFDAIDDSELKKSFIDNVVTVEDPEEIEKVLISLYPYYLTSYIMDTLRDQGRQKVIEDMFRNACRNYRENADLFTYLARTYDRKFWEKKIKVPFETLLTSELQLLDFAFNAIEAKKATNENRKIAKTLTTILFEERVVFDFLKGANEGSAQRVNFIVQRMQGLDQSRKIEVKHAILEKYPDFVFLGEEENSTEMVTSGLLVTQARYQEKQLELDRIMNVEIPENSKEIGAALSLGDLRENSEFKAAKEKQGILNTTMMRLTEEISRAVIVTQSMVDASKVSFGTEVVLKNNLNGNEDIYRIFGPWESNPAENTISYLAPFGAKLLNHTPGERFTFEINETKYDYTVVSISGLLV